MPQRTTWVLVANGTTAKVFEHAGEGAGLNAIPDLMFDEEPVLAQDLAKDRPGRTFESAGNGRSGYEPATDPVDARETRFMKRMAERLEEKLRIGAFDRLVIVAAPAALGMIRPYLSKSLQGAVVQEVAKDFTNHPTPEIEKHLNGVLPM